MALQVELERTKWKSDLRVLRLKGRLDMETVSVLEKAVRDELPKAPFLWAVDLARLDYMSSAGVAALFGMLYALEPLQGQLCFFSVSGRIAHVFNLLGVLDSVTLFRDEAYAKRMFERKLEPSQKKSPPPPRQTSLRTEIKTYQWTLPAVASLVPKAVQRLRAAILSNALAAPLADDLELVFEEAIVNIIKHTYHNDASMAVHIRLHFMDQGLEVVLTDEGPPLDPNALPKVDLAEYHESKRTGGLGVHLMRRLMDEVEYSPGKKRGNSLRLFKTWPSPGDRILNQRLHQPIDAVSLYKAQSALCAHGLRLGLDRDLVSDLAQAFHELATNILEHSQARWFDVALGLDDALAVLTFRDDGVPFDTVEACAFMDTPFPFVERHLGLYMLGKLPFAMAYRRVDKSINELVLRQTQAAL